MTENNGRGRKERRRETERKENSGRATYGKGV
jgi:hypothetical protein